MDKAKPKSTPKSLKTRIQFHKISTLTKILINLMLTAGKWRLGAAEMSLESPRVRGARAGWTRTIPHAGHVDREPLLKYINRYHHYYY